MICSIIENPFSWLILSKLSANVASNNQFERQHLENLLVNCLIEIFAKASRLVLSIK